jgi:ABC-type transport system involved in Fe-S cluster assembly fused permease/ATPase subunit
MSAATLRLALAAASRHKKKQKVSSLSGPTVSSDSGSTLNTIRNLWPYMWPSDRPDLKVRVVWAFLFLVLAKLVLILVPYFFKFATDALNGKLDTSDWLMSFPAWALVPVMLVLAYNVARIGQWGFNQLRDALFARVGQHAVRQLAYKTFVHMHKLSLRFHLERRTGGLSRIIERGTKGIEIIVRFTILNTLPTILEFALTAVIFWWTYGFSYVAIIATVVWLYSWFTVRASDWRISIRKEMNQSDNDANTKAIDSLLNFETVKYFGNEEMESRRFDSSMKRYESAATKTWTSLGWLNFGQGLIFGIGMTIVMILSALEVQKGNQTLGDFVFINAMLMQLSIPLNFIGFVYREIRQGLADIEQMFDLLAVDAGDHRPAWGNAAEGRRRPGSIFDNVDFAYDPKRKILKRIWTSRCRLAAPSPSSARPAQASRRSRGCCSASTTSQDGAITIDGQDIREVTQKSLRAAIGMVPQDTVLFNDTIRYNIRYGRPDATDAEVEKAAGLAQITTSSVAAGWLRLDGRRARPETVRRREAARRHRPHDSQGAADPDPRRGDFGARYRIPSRKSSRRSRWYRRTAPRWSSRTACRP